MPPTAIQLWTLRDVDEPLPEIIRRVGQTSFDGVELAGLDGHAPAVIADALDDAGLGVAGAHVGLDALQEGERADTLEAYDTVECSFLVVPYIDPEYFETIEGVEAVAADLDEAAVDLADTNHTVCYHNHAHEFVDLDGEVAFDRLAAASSTVGFEVDTGWVKAAGHDPATVVERHADRTPLLHVTDHDVETGDHAEVGEGDVDNAAAIAAAGKLEWLVYEHDEPEDPLASLEAGAKYLEQFR
jgi:sugar phosphate isomerase/epimerase